MKQTTGMIQVQQDENNLCLFVDTETVDMKFVERLMDAFIDGKASMECITDGAVAFKDRLVNLSAEKKSVIVFRITE